jgi:RES domain-containing protein
MPAAWRIVKRKHARRAFDGEGARLYGGRWNSPGTRVVYTSQSLALAALEMLVHLDHARLLSSYVVFGVTFDDALVEKLDRSRLPAGWRKVPAPRALRAFGDAWIAAGTSAVLEVPSAIVEESNYLLSPAHPDFPRLQIRPPAPFQLDPRLLRPARGR